MLRFAIRVKPGAARPAVGGRYGAKALVVAVVARAVDGAANRAAIAALAEAFSVRRADVELVGGATARTKTVAIMGDPAVLEARLARLLGGPDRRGQ